jgi:hypothetical protein
LLTCCPCTGWGALRDETLALLLAFVDAEAGKLKKAAGLDS